MLLTRPRSQVTAPNIPRVDRGHPINKGALLIARPGPQGNDIVNGHNIGGPRCSWNSYWNHGTNNELIGAGDPVLGACLKTAGFSTVLGVRWPANNENLTGDIEAGGRLLEPTNDITIMFRGYISGWNGSYGIILSKPWSYLGTYPAPGASYGFRRYSNTDRMEFGIANQSSTWTDTSTTGDYFDVNTDPQWHTYVITRSGSTVRAYRDGSWASGGTAIGGGIE